MGGKGSLTDLMTRLFVEQAVCRAALPGSAKHGWEKAAFFTTDHICDDEDMNASTLLMALKVNMKILT